MICNAAMILSCLALLYSLQCCHHGMHEVEAVATCERLWLIMFVLSNCAQGEPEAGLKLPNLVAVHI
jgi:hypothetical protein